MRVLEMLFSHSDHCVALDMSLFLTVSAVNSGGLSLTSVTLMTAVAVLERPYIGLPSMSVAWMISVYWGTFWKGKEEKQHKD